MVTRCIATTIATNEIAQKASINIICMTGLNKVLLGWLVFYLTVLSYVDIYVARREINMFYF